MEMRKLFSTTATQPLSSGETAAFPSPQIPLPDDAKILTLPDGRKMGYAEYGSPPGQPFIFVHGIPDCRIDCCFTAEDKAIAKRLNIRWIGIDRPGIGLSSPQPNRTILDWPQDVQHLTSHLGLTTYRVFGVSGGTAYALACAIHLPRDRLLSVGIMAGMAPLFAGLKGMSLANRIGLRIWQRLPWVMEAIINRSLVPTLMNSDRGKAEEMFRKQAKYMSKVDKEFGTKEAVQMLTTILREVYRQGSARAHAEENRLANSHWGFELEDVIHDRIRLWYGTKDVNTPVEQGQYMAARIPGATIKEYEGNTHFDIWKHLEEMLTSMLEDG